MSDKQLTVAEILARASKDSNKPATPRSRRRRRSMEEGGITVAELTGSIPRVDKTPDQPRHTAQPLDDAAVPANSGRHGENADHAGVEYATPAESEGTSNASKATSSTRRRQDDADTMVLKVVKEGDPVRFTTDSFPAVTPEEAEHGRRAEVTTERPDRNLVDAAMTPPVRTPEHEAAVDVEPAPDDDAPYQDGDDLSADGVYTSKDTPETTTAEPVRRQPEDDSEDRPMSIAMVVAMTLVAVVIGAGIFKGFQLLWTNFHSAITAVLAVAVTASIVGVVHAMRTEKDKLSMVIAGVVGLVLTFGPSLIAGI